MTAKRTPATPLHGRRIILQGGYVFEVQHQHVEHLDVLQHRANAYPKLVEALRDIGMRPLAEREYGAVSELRRVTDLACALLRSLGEE